MNANRITLTGGQRAQAELARIAGRLGRGLLLRVGFLENARYEDNITQVAQVAFWQEFGTSTAPPRPFMRPTVAKKSRTWVNVVAANLVATDYDEEQTLRILGQVIQTQIVRAINELTEPKLAQSTIDAKGFDKPLIDSGTMQRKVDYDVR